MLEELVSGVRGAVGGSFLGAYLQGSLAVGGFDQHSDVDFVVVTEHALSDSQVDALQAVHQQIHAMQADWAKHLEGSYFPKDVLRDFGRRGELLWYLDHGSRELVRSAHDNTLVVRWILRELGVVLGGPYPSALIDRIPEFMLRRDIWDTIHDWGNEILADPEQINSRFYQAFAVLSYCRMLHDLKVSAIDSKRAGAEWAMANLDPSWSDLIDRAWDGRPDPAQSVREPADAADLARTLDFVRHAMQVSDELQAEHQAAGWEAYYQRHKDREPADLLLEALKRFDSGRPRLHAIDLGCGQGTETLGLLESGWRVLAIDNQPAAIAHLQSAVDPQRRVQLELRLASFEELEFPRTDFVWAGYSLPFSKPGNFNRLWANLASSIRPGGRFAGQLFGIRDTWASEPEMTFHTAAQVNQLLASDFEIEVLRETEEDGDSGAGPKHWHLFDIIARKRAFPSI